MAKHLTATARRKRSGAVLGRADPTRTITLRKGFAAVVKRAFTKLKLRLIDLIERENALGLVSNCQPGQLRGTDGKCGPGIGVDIPREQMPQINGEDLREFARYCKEQGARLVSAEVKADQLSPTQAEFRQERVDALPEDALQQPVIVSEDLYILDGTHRWVKHWQGDPQASVPVLLLPRKLQAALKLMREFPKAKFVTNVFCPTGEGGGIDPSCSPPEKKVRVTAKQKRILEEVDKRITEAVKEFLWTKEQKEIEFGFKLTPPRETSWEDLPTALSLSSDIEALVSAGLLEKRQAGNRTLLRRAGVPEDYYFPSGPATNARWAFVSSPEQVDAFKSWLQTQINQTLLNHTEQQLWAAYVQAGFLKGAARSYDDYKGKRWGAGEGDFYAGSKQEFLRTSFAQPTTVDKVRLLASRSFHDLQGVTTQMGLQITRHLIDGLVQGKSPWDIAQTMSADIDSIGRDRALLIARTEIIRAHAEGQLMALENLGVAEVGVQVEWSTTGDSKVCPLCRPLQGIVLTMQEAHGMIPRHPNCRCAWVPAGLGEPSTSQTKTAPGIRKAVKVSQQLGPKSDDWAPAVPIAASRPKSLLGNVFCPTGEGGGVDPTCSPGENRFDDDFSGRNLAERALEELNPRLKQTAIKDNRGKPVLVFHGSATAFSEFREGPTYFSPDPRYGFVSKSDNLHVAFLDIRNPFHTDDQAVIERVGYDPEHVAELKSQGHDGVVYSQQGNILKGFTGIGDDYPQYIAFSKSQIISIGKYDRSDFDWRNERGDLYLNAERSAAALDLFSTFLQEHVTHE